MFAKNSSFPARPTKSIIPTWPLQRWGIDIVGILPTAPGNLRYAAVALEYFTKWIEAKPLANITSKTLQNFVWQRVICRFGVPAYITVDNGKQFDCAEFRSFCDELGIKLSFASVYHPQSNGAVERANGLIFSVVSKVLHNMPKGKWAEELTSVVWAHNISASRATGFTPFRLLYGEEAITPEELRLESFRTAVSPTNPVERYVNIEAIEQTRLQAAANLDKYHDETKSWRDKKVVWKDIKPGNWVLIRHLEKQGKLQTQWHGPYIVAGQTGDGTFRLKDEEGNEFSYTYNIDNLRRFYP